MRSSGQMKGRAPRVLATLGLALALAGATVSGAVARSDASTPATACDTGRDLFVAAHEDDPLLFMLPDLGQDIVRSRCVRVVILTTGDAGLGRSYWERREAGLAAALAEMSRVADDWHRQDAGIPGHTAPLYTLNANPRVSLLFLELPDGGFAGQGFDGRGSLKQLWEDKIATLTSVAGGPTLSGYRPSTYSHVGLVKALLWLMVDFRPTMIGLQDFVGSVDGSGDHSDHRAGARFALAAAQLYPWPAHLVGYQDYDILAFPSNIGAQGTALKQAAFYAYVPYDDQLKYVCPTPQSCMTPGNYGNYWSRQYRLDPALRLPVKAAA